MKTLSLLGGAAALLILAPMTAANAQSMDSPAMAPPAVDASATVTQSGNWTLKQREDWLHNRVDKSHSDGSLDSREYDRVKEQLADIHHDEAAFRDHQSGQLTDNQTAMLETRLDDVAAKIHWVQDANFQRPW
jgi:hypothetical protein